VWLARHDLMPDGVRPWLLRRAGHQVDGSAVIFAGLRLSGERRLVVGKRAFISFDCLVDCSADVVIEEGVALAAGTRIISSGHEFDDPRQRAGARTMAPVTIGAGAWLGAGSTVLAGLTVGPGVVVAAGAVVTRDCSAHGVYAGVPARRIRELLADPA
jgi:acetyltransferase-like isoleucine patch superfamily enzyme